MEKKVSNTADILKAMQKREDTVSSALQQVNRIKDDTYNHVERELGNVHTRIDDY